MIQFPKDFLWGAATSAYQVEGNNTKSDWWQWERKSGVAGLSRQACRHYEFFEQDFDLAVSLNHNSHRLSVEWSRIEPQQGFFAEEEITHYKKVISALNKRNLEPVVTLSHFTIPQWFADMGGWKNKSAVNFFLRFVRKTVSALAPNVRFWITINEPLVYVYHSYMLGVWPPQEKSLFAAQKVTATLVDAHIKSYRLIRDLYKESNLNRPWISIAKNIQAFEPCISSIRNKIATAIRDRVYNFDFLDKLMRAQTLDFIGVNYYSRNLVELYGWWPKNFAMDCCRMNHSRLRKNSLGWDIYPKGLYDMLIKLNRYNLPIMITENGICTDDDGLRWDFIREHLSAIHKAIEDGVNVTGYLYWSLLDNFEWDKGFAPRFGLIDVDYDTFKRTVRESAYKYAQVCKSGILQ
jgi:beta-glucosidase